MLARIRELFGPSKKGEEEEDGDAEDKDDDECKTPRGGEEDDATLQEIIDAAPRTPERAPGRRNVPVVATPVPYDPDADTAPPPPLGDGASVRSAEHVALEEDAQRGAAWRVLLRVGDLRARFNDSVYERLTRVGSPHAKSIHKDIRRTFPTHPFYASSPEHRAALHRVVSAYSVYDTVGYSQGMAFVAGYLFLHMSEVDAFFSMAQLMTSRKHNLRELFSAESPLLGLMLAEFDHQLELHMPALAGHLRGMGVGATMYACPWFLTVFVYRFPPESLPVIWDEFVRSGVRAVFQTGLVILAHYHETLMRMREEEIVPFFNNLRPVPAEVLLKARRVRISRLAHVRLD